jgi:glutathione S-transferase
MAFAYPWTALVTLVALFIYLVFVSNVGKARGVHGVKAPTMTGPPEFERVLRVQMNTLEQLALYLPALWLFAALWGDFWAALIGVVWPVGRVIYALNYYQAAERRGLGFMIGLACTGILLVGVLVGLVRRLF